MSWTRTLDPSRGATRCSAPLSTPSYRALKKNIGKRKEASSDPCRRELAGDLIWQKWGHWRPAIVIDEMYDGSLLSGWLVRTISNAFRNPPQLLWCHSYCHFVWMREKRILVEVECILVAGRSDAQWKRKIVKETAIYKINTYFEGCHPWRKVINGEPDERERNSQNWQLAISSTGKKMTSNILRGLGSVTHSFVVGKTELLYQKIL